MKKLLVLLPLFGLAACNTSGGGIVLTPAQQASLACLALSDGTVIAANFASGGAASTVAKLTNVSPIACQAATQIATVVTTPAQAQAASVAAVSGGSVPKAVAAVAASGK